MSSAYRRHMYVSTEAGTLYRRAENCGVGIVREDYTG
jgi:hypothetical protein